MEGKTCRRYRGAFVWILEWLIRCFFSTTSSGKRGSVLATCDLFFFKFHKFIFVCIAESICRQTDLLLHWCSTKRQNSSVTNIHHNFTVHVAIVDRVFSLFSPLSKLKVYFEEHFKDVEVISIAKRQWREGKILELLSPCDTNCIFFAWNWKCSGKRAVLWSNCKWLFSVIHNEQESAAAKLSSGVFVMTPTLTQEQNM